MSKFRTALTGIDGATRDNVQRSIAIQERIEWLEARLDAGDALIDLIREEPRPIIVEMITTNIETLQSLGLRLRQAEAQALHAEGLTMDEIGQLFGVTRQRISALLKHSPA